MLREIRLDGFKLLDEFTADFDQLTVVIGANACGKSSLLDALSLISRSLEYPIEEVLGRKGGLGSILSLSRQTNEVGWQLKIQKPNHHSFWSNMPLAENEDLFYEVRLAQQNTGESFIDFECLRKSESLEHPERLTLLELQKDRALVYDPKSRQMHPLNQPQVADGDVHANPESLSEVQLKQKVSLLLSQMRFVNEYPLPTWVRSYCANFAFYPGFDVSRDSPLRTKLAEIRVEPTLSETGENLGTVLHELLTRHTFRFFANELREFLSAAYPQVEDIYAETSFGAEPRVLVRIKEQHLSRATEIWEMSDGMLRFLLLCAALLNPIVPPLIAIDEPETGLHPKLLPIVADLIRSAATRTQVIVTTHSPQLLQMFDLDHVAVMSRRDGRANWFRPRDRESLRRMLEAEIGSTIGDLHASGELESMS